MTTKKHTPDSTKARKKETKLKAEKARRRSKKHVKL